MDGAYWTVVAFNSLIFILGVPGNVIILLVYGSKTTKLSSHIFIIGLACADLFIACLRPVAILNWKHNILCKISLASTYLALFSSIFLTTAIACDRFFAVCTRHKFTPIKAKVIVSCCIITAFMLSGISFATFGLIDTGGTPICGIIQSASWQMHLMVMLFSITFILSLAIIIVLYLLIYRVIRRQAKIQASWSSNGQTQNAGNMVTITPPPISEASAVPETSVDPPCTSMQNSEQPKHADTLQRGASSLELLARSSELPTSAHARKSNKKPQSGPKIQNRTTKMMFLTTLVFFVSWIPGISLRFIPQSKFQELYERGQAWRVLLLIPQYLVLINHAVNPFIYSFVNRRFREDCKNVMNRCKRMCRKLW